MFIYTPLYTIHIASKQHNKKEKKIASVLPSSLNSGVRISVIITTSVLTIKQLSSLFMILLSALDVTSERMNEKVEAQSTPSYNAKFMDQW